MEDTLQVPVGYCLRHWENLMMLGGADLPQMCCFSLCEPKDKWLGSFFSGTSFTLVINLRYVNWYIFRNCHLSADRLLPTVCSSFLFLHNRVK